MPPPSEASPLVARPVVVDSSPCSCASLTLSPWGSPPAVPPPPSSLFSHPYPPPPPPIVPPPQPPLQAPHRQLALWRARARGRGPRVSLGATGRVQLPAQALPAAPWLATACRGQHRERDGPGRVITHTARATTCSARRDCALSMRVRQARGRRMADTRWQAACLPRRPPAAKSLRRRAGDERGGAAAVVLRGKVVGDSPDRSASVPSAPNVIPNVAPGKGATPQRRVQARAPPANGGRARTGGRRAVTCSKKTRDRCWLAGPCALLGDRYIPQEVYRAGRQL